MVTNMDRRQLLRLSAGAAAGLTAAAVLPSTPASAGTRSGPALPVVPGMSGDVRANEFWYQFDEVLYFDKAPELTEAYAAITANFSALEEGVAYFWLEQRASAEYRATYTAAWRPVRSALKYLMDTQLSIMDRYYDCDERGLEQAFVDFGQGILLDPRRDPNPVHTMDGKPPAGYHIWHAYMRAAIFLGISPARWTRIDKYNGIAWHLQSIAKPTTTAVSAPLAASVVRDVREVWNRRGSEQVDLAYTSVPFPAGVS